VNGQQVQFGRVPYPPIEAGIVTQMKPADAKVYIVLCMHANKNWIACPGQRRIAKLTGLTHGTVQVAAERLAALGAIEVEAGRGSRPTTYRICALASQGAIDGLRPTADSDRALQRRDFAPYGGANCALYPQGQTEEQKKKQSSNTSAAAYSSSTNISRVRAKPGKYANVGITLDSNFPSDPILSELDRLGITAAKTRTAIASTPNITVGAIGEALRTGEAARDGCPVGVRVNALRDHLPAAIEAIRQREERISQAAQAKHEQEERHHLERQQIEQQRQEVRSAIDAMADDELQELKQQVVARYEDNPIARSTFERADPKTHPGLMREIVVIAKPNVDTKERH
jgi:hypothetical protein